jgi:hypothetical protein
MGYVKTNYQYCRLTTRCIEWILRKISCTDHFRKSGQNPVKEIGDMGKKLYPADTLKQAQSLLAAWEQIDPSLAIGPVTSAALLAEVESARALKDKIDRLQIELLDLRNQRDELCIGIWDKVKRARSGVKGFYGDDSTEYEIAGGTRASDRKPIRRKTPVHLKDV